MGLLTSLRLSLAVLTEINVQGEALKMLVKSAEYDGTCRSAARGYHSLPNYILEQVIASQLPQSAARTVSQDLNMLDDEEIREKAKIILGNNIPEDLKITAMVEFLSEIRNIRRILANDPTGFSLVNDLYRAAVSVSSLDDHPDANSFGLQKAVDRYGILYRMSAEKLKR